MEITVRRAVPSDVDALADLVRSYRDFYEPSRPTTDGERRFIGKASARSDEHDVFRPVDGRPAGFVQIFESWSTVHLAPV